MHFRGAEEGYWILAEMGKGKFVNSHHNVSNHLASSSVEMVMFLGEMICETTVKKKNPKNDAFINNEDKS